MEILKKKRKVIRSQVTRFANDADKLLNSASAVDLEEEVVKVLHYPTSKLESVKSVSGAGDCLAGGFLCGLLRQLPWDRSMGIGMAAARRSLMSSDTVPDTVGADCLDAVSTSRTVDLQWCRASK
ncbi:hypothetical protein MTO96_017912 [Rhipicephalus appendiculatus]